MHILDFASRTRDGRARIASSDDDQTAEPYTRWTAIDVEAGRAAPGALEALCGNDVAGMRIHGVLPPGTARATGLDKEGVDAVGAKIRAAVETALSIKIDVRPDARSVPVIAGLDWFPSGLRVDRAACSLGKREIQLAVVGNLGPAACRPIRIYRQPWRASDFAWMIPGSGGTFDRRLVAGAPCCSWALPPGALHIVNSALPYDIDAGDAPPAALTLGMFVTLHGADQASASVQ